jgi:glycosyltransferase involved in cell wall biosynthesis
MYACLAGWLARCPVVLTLHEPPAHRRLRAVFDGRWIRWLVDEVVAASAATAAEHRHFLGQRDIHIVHYCMMAMPQGLELRRTGKPIVAFIGLVARKRYDDFLRACHRLKERGVEFEAWLVGEWDTPQDRAKAEDLITRQGLGDVVVHKGLVQEMDALYRSMAVVAAPSEPVEALPRVVMEAMSYGVPVVATPVNGVPEMVQDGETGFLVPVGDVEALADRLERLLHDPLLREQMGRAGRRRAETQFAPERFQREMLAIYRRVVGND